MLSNTRSRKEKYLLPTPDPTQLKCTIHEEKRATSIGTPTPSIDTIQRQVTIDAWSTPFQKHRSIPVHELTTWSHLLYWPEMWMETYLTQRATCVMEHVERSMIRGLWSLILKQMHCKLFWKLRTLQLMLIVLRTLSEYLLDNSWDRSCLTCCSRRSFMTIHIVKQQHSNEILDFVPHTTHTLTWTTSWTCCCLTIRIEYNLFNALRWQELP